MKIIQRIILLNLFGLTIALLCSCERMALPPVISFENDLDSIAGVFPGDPFKINGQIFSKVGISKAFYFHQKKDKEGSIKEEGDRLDLENDGKFSLNFITEVSTIGVKLIAEDHNGNRAVKLFKVIHGVDGLEISFEEPGSIEDIDSGESFVVKGKVISKTKITALNYNIIKGDIFGAPVDIDISSDKESSFELSLSASSGMTGVSINAANKSGLETSKVFQIEHVFTIGAVILFDKEEIEVKPDSIFTVSGKITSDREVSSISYSILRDGNSDAPVSIDLTNDRFNFDVNAGKDVTGVILNVKDVKGNETENTLPVSILFPSATIKGVMVHYKNIILTDERFENSYFSFSTEPYVLNRNQATANQQNVDMIFSNVFVSTGHTVNGPSIFGPNVSTGGTIKANDYVDGWTKPYNLTRIAYSNDFLSTVGKTFDEIGDTQEEWNNINDYLKSKIANSSVARGYRLSDGDVFVIGYGGKTVGEIDKYAIAKVLSIGGEKATSPKESTGAWLELEIKMMK